VFVSSRYPFDFLLKFSHCPWDRLWAFSFPLVAHAETDIRSRKLSPAMGGRVRVSCSRAEEMNVVLPPSAPGDVRV
jgi:hypothetical protein